MERYILTISSELFDETEQEASVRKNLTIRALIEEVRQEYKRRPKSSNRCDPLA